MRIVLPVWREIGAGCKIAGGRSVLSMMIFFRAIKSPLNAGISKLIIFIIVFGFVCLPFGNNN